MGLALYPRRAYLYEGNSPPCGPEVESAKTGCGRLDSESRGFHAPRGYGKTTLAEAALARARQDGALAVRIDLYGVTSRMTLYSRIEEAFERELSGAVVGSS